MNRRAIRAIAAKDLRVVLQSRMVLIPIILLPLIMLVLLPGGMALAPSALGGTTEALSDLDRMLEGMPSSMQAELASYNPSQRIIALMILYLLAPMYLIVPLMVASVIAADSFAGEKERKTLEALLYTPASDRELFVAKMISAWVPAVVVGLVGFVLYGLVANLAGWPTMGRVFFPNATWVVLALWVGPAVAGLGLGATVLVSSRVATFQEAYQMGGMVVLPVIFLVVGQASGVMYLGLGLVLLLGLVLWIVDAALLWVGAKTFRRGELMARV